MTIAALTRTITCALLFATPLFAQTAPTSARNVELFDRSWKFFLGDPSGAEQPSFDDSSWHPVDLPHDWSIAGPPNVDPTMQGAMEGPFDKNSPAKNGGAYLNGGIGWYRKAFELPDAAKNQHFTLLFDGAYQNSHVWINGHDLGVRPYGFVSFFYDLTPYLKFGGSNVVAVRLEVDQPGCRWYSGAGIYRHVYLISTAPVHIGTWGTYVTTPKAAADGAEVHVKTTVKNDGAESSEVKLTTIVLDPGDKEVARQDTTKTVTAGASETFDQSLPLASASLWSLETPVLYHAVNEVRVGDTLTDSTSTPFGIRTIEFTKDKGFFLNGKHVQIQGVCLHHDLGCLGAAAYRRAIERQLQVVRSFGCNAIRTSHNPPSPELLDLCDQMGFLVMDEAFDEWKANHQKYGYGQNFEQWSDPDLSSMIERDRNHPSIVLYSIGNEIIEGHHGKPEAGPLAKRLVAICHREDPTRPVTSACARPSSTWKSGLSGELDVFGVNYTPSWYDLNDPSKIPATIPPGDTGYHGQLPLIASETSSQVDSRGEYGLKLDAQGNVVIDPLPNFQVSSYDTWHTGWACSGETDLLNLKNHPWVAGEFVWTGFDYLGEPTPYAWPSRSSYFGIVDTCGFPKDRYYLYKSVWSDEPMVHLLPMSWTWPGFEGKTIPVRAFTNADSVELFLNGKSLGVRNFPADCAKQVDVTGDKDITKPGVTHVLPGLRLAWDVVYEPGTLKAVATKNGQVVATDEIQTAGAPATIKMEPDRTQIAADGQDLSFVKVSILDKNGIVCPDADNEIHFTLKGESATIAGLDDGDATNHEAFQGTQHKAFHGLALAVLKSQYDKPGSVTLTASASGLSPAATTIEVVRPETNLNK
jgi:beta-galactosidase